MQVTEILVSTILLPILQYSINEKYNMYTHYRNSVRGRHSIALMLSPHSVFTFDIRLIIIMHSVIYSIDQSIITPSMWGIRLKGGVLCMNTDLVPVYLSPHTTDHKQNIQGFRDQIVWYLIHKKHFVYTWETPGVCISAIALSLSPHLPWPHEKKTIILYWERNFAPSPE